MPRVFNPLDFGSQPIGKRAFDGAASTNTVTSATAGFTSSMTGWWILLPGAGAGNTDLSAQMTFVNSTTVTISPSVTNSVSADTINFGPDCTPGIQAALNADSANGGGKVIFPNGPLVTNGAGRVENGTWVLASPLVTNYGGNPNCLIHIPIYPAGVPFTNRTHFTLEGETDIDPDSYSDRLGDSLVPHTGVILLPFTQGSGNAPAVFGSKARFGWDFCEYLLCHLQKSSDICS